MPHVHWLGAGLSSPPGIRRLALATHPLTVWNRSADKSRAALAGLDSDSAVRPLSLDALSDALEPGDVAVSMLPGDWHLAVAERCLARGAHFVCSSYITPAMRALDAPARARGLSLVNEIGLDPGIDHLMAHALVADWRASDLFDPAARLHFRSWCGGFPAEPNEFRYKFSWSPVGVLKALAAPSRCIRAGQVVDYRRPWEAISGCDAVLPDGSTERFECYPNRDATPFIAAYGFDPQWRIETFVRGTLRLPGWAAAWAPLFAQIDALTGTDGEARLAQIGAELWRQHAYAPGEPDRVVLMVELLASRDGRVVWHRCHSLDSRGEQQHSAMARLVSTPVSYAVEAVLAGQLPSGVSAASDRPALVADWLQRLVPVAGAMASLDRLPLH